MPRSVAKVAAALGDIVPERGSRLSKADAQALVAVARRLMDEGRYSVAAMVDEARRPDSSIHHLLDWDTEAAAQRAWEYEMAGLMRKIEIVVHTDRGEERVRWIQTVVENNVSRTFTIDTMEYDEAAEVANQAFRDAVFFVSRYEVFTSLYPEQMRPFAEIISAARRLRDLRQKMQEEGK